MDIGNVVANFDVPLVAALIVALVGITTAVAASRRPDGRLFGFSSRTLVALTASAVAATATGLPRSWPIDFGQGDLVLRIGDDALGNTGLVLREPWRLSSALYILNIVLYVPVGLLWARARGSARAGIVAGATTSIIVELLQLAFLDRVAATDDLILNVGGATLGALIWVLASRQLAATTVIHADEK